MKISVITCTYNRKDLLLQAIQSLQRSALEPLADVSWEHLIYDDGSTDGTDELFASNAWENVSYFRDEQNRGPSFGRNFLIDKASGDYIFMLDSDDIVLQRTLFNFTQLARQNPDVDWFMADFVCVDEELRYLPGQDHYGWEYADRNEMLGAIFKGEHFIQSSVLFKKQLFLQSGRFDTDLRMAEDLDLFIRFLLIGSMPVYSPFISHFHRTHAGNLSSQETLARHVDRLQELRGKYQDRLEAIGLSPARP